MKPIRAFGKTVAILGVALALGVGVCFLPENEYQRWQLLDDTIHARAKWIYERCSFDPTPIDVAFIGPSRIGAGVDAPQLAEALDRRGLKSNVVNFSLPEAGRNINYAIAQLLLERKHPKLLVIGVMEKPSRFGHPAFKYIAPAILVADPGYVADFDYLTDLIYLPFRQMYLFVADLAPGATGLTKRFDPTFYLGPSIDTTGSIVLPDGTVKNGESPASPAELERGVRKLENSTHPPLLPARLADLEFGDERHYVRLIAEMARAKGIRVAFLFLPYYSGPSQVQEEKLYEQYGPVWNAGFLANHADWFADYGHLTRTGAEHLTDWLVDPVESMLTTTAGVSQ